jgi:hypothetical protein
MLQAADIRARDTVRSARRCRGLRSISVPIKARNEDTTAELRRVKALNRRFPPRRRSGTMRSCSSHAWSVPRMIGVTILAVTDNSSWLEFFWEEARLIQGTRLVATGSMEEACGLLRHADARLIVVDWQDATVSSEQMDQLLWSNSILAHPASVLVVEDSYRGDHASSLFHMGVDDYIGLSEHSDRLRMILARLLARTTPHKIRCSQMVAQASRPVLDLLSQPARRAVAASSA